MEESIFENSCEYSKENLAEMYTRFMKKRQIIPCIVWLILMCTYSYLLFAGGFELYIVILMVVLTILMIADILYVPKKQAKTVCKRSTALYSKTQEDHVAFYETHFIANNLQSKAEIDLPYDKVISVSETKNLYLIVLKAKSIIMVHKNGFTKGTRERFVSFLEAKDIEFKYFI